MNETDISDDHVEHEHDSRKPIFKESNAEKLQYSMEIRPPVSVVIFAAFQHILLTLVSLVLVPLIIADVLCADANDPLRMILASSTMFMTGLSTILQTLFGVRLPVFQGPAAGFIIVLLAVRNTEEWTCTGLRTANVTHVNSSESVDVPLSQEEKLRQLSGTVMVGSLVEIFIGGTGLVGILSRYVGPITVAPTIAVMGLTLYNVTIQYSKSSWELSLFGAVLMLIFSMYLDRIGIPCPTCNNCKCKRDENRRGVRIFHLFPVLFSMIIVWILSAILTYTDVFPYDTNHSRFMARVDAKAKLIHFAPWFYFPYPGQFGMPSFNVGIFIGFIAAYFASIIESVGDYFAAARACQVSTPPEHAVNRGIMMEGVGALLSGAFGIGHATTSYTHNIAVITLTKTANRYVLVFTGIVLVITSVIGKVGAVLATVPEPALAGVLIALCGMLVAMGLSTLHHVNLSSSRNLLIVGMAMYMGIFIPQWVEKYPDFFKTGNKEVDNILLVVLGTPMFLTGVIALILDNTARGSRKDRGLVRQDNYTMNGSSSDSTEDTDIIYGWSWQGRLYEIAPFFSKLPFMPPHYRDEWDNVELKSV